MIRTKKFENLPQITTISPSGKIVITENGVDKVISFEDFSNLPPSPEVWNNPSTTFTASEINVTDIQSAADSKLLDLKVNTVSKFVVRKDGNLGIGVVNPAARLDISDTVLAGSGSLAGSILNLAQTWNTTGAPTAIKLNVTNTTSGATSNLLDLQLGGVSNFKVTKNGSIYASGGLSYEAGYNIFRASSFLALGDRVGFSDSGFTVGSGRKFNFAPSWGWENAEFSLLREGSHIMAQRGVVSTNPQSFRIYNTYTSGTNFERLNLRWDSNILKIGTEKGSAGGVARDLAFETDATTRMTITSTGLVGIGTTNPTASLDIQGASSGIFLGRSDSEKYIYIQTSASTGYTANSFAIWNGITAAWAGLIMQFNENAALIFNRDIQNAYTNIRGANLSEPALNITQTSTGDFLSAGSLRVAKNGNIGIGITVPTAVLDIVDTTLSGSGSLAGSALNIAQTWNTTGAPTAIKLNVTNTASGATSNLLDLQTDGITKFKVDKNGVITFGSTLRTIVSDGSGVTIGGVVKTSNYFSGQFVSGEYTKLIENNFVIGSIGKISFMNGPSYVAEEFKIQREGVGILGQQGGLTPQAFRLYNTYTNTTNFERLNLRWDSNILKIGTEKGSAGGVARELAFETDATTRMTITSAGNVGIGTTNPLNLLHVQGSAIITNGIMPNLGNYAWSFGYHSGGPGVYGGAYASGIDRFISLRGSNAIKLKIANQFNQTIFCLDGDSGRLALGNINPLAKLDISDTWDSNISVTGASGTGSVATITFATQAAAIPVGATVVVSSVNPSGYNGTFVVTASSVTSVSYANATSTAYVSGGTVQQLFAAVKVNVTDTASASTSNLLDLQVDTVSKFKVDKAGMVISTSFVGSASASFQKSAPAFRFSAGSFPSGLNWDGSGFDFVSGNGRFQRFTSSGIIVRDSAYFGFGASIEAGSADLTIYRDSSNILAQRNGVNPQAFRLYGTYTDASNYARLSISCDTSGNAILATEGLGTGAAGTITINGVSLGLGKGNVSTNLAIGTSALNANTTGSQNTAIGVNACSLNTSASSNTAVGFNSLVYNSTGQNNVAIGTWAGGYAAVGGGNSISNSSIFIGADCRPSTSNQTNQIVIGSSAVGIGSNSVVLGNDSILTTALKGNVGIGTTAPLTKLHVNGGENSISFGVASIALGYQNTNQFSHFIHTRHNGGGIGVFGNAIDFYTSNGTPNGVFPTNAVHGLTIDNGSLGIGITSPLAKLDIAETWNGAAIAVTGASGTGSVATITFATQAAAIPVGATVVVSSVNPSGYNGTFVVTASTVTSISYTNSTSTTYVSGGTVQQLFTAVKVNVTDTASNVDSNLLDLQVGGVRKFKVNKSGYAIANRFMPNTHLGMSWFGSDDNYNLRWYVINEPRMQLTGYGGLQLAGGASLSWTSSGTDATLTPDTLLLRDGAANTLAMRNGVNPQTFRLYNTYTDATTFERLNIKWDTNVLKIGTEKGASGGTARAMELQTDGVSRWSISTAGHLLAGADNTYDIGANGATRPRTGYFGTSLITPTITITTPDTNTQAITVLGQSGGQSAKLQSWGWASSPNETYIDGSGNLFARSVSTNSTISVGSFSFGSLTAEPGSSTGLYGDNTAQEIRIKTGNLVKWKITNTGHLLANTDNTFDIGASGATRPRNIYVGTSITAGVHIVAGTSGYFYISGRTAIGSPSAGVHTLLDDGGSFYNRLQFGGTSSAFPSIKRNGTALQIRLADDSSNTTLEAGNIYATGNLGIGTTSPLNALHVIGKDAASGSDFIALFHEPGITPQASAVVSTAADKSIMVQGSGGAFYLGRDVTNSIEFAMGTSSLGEAFAGAMSSHKFSLRTSNSNRLTIDTVGNVGIGTISPASKLDIADVDLAGSGSLAGSILNLAQTWNTTGAPTAIKLNVTNTASGAASNLLDLQVGTVSKFKVSKGGSIFSGAAIGTNAGNPGADGLSFEMFFAGYGMGTNSNGDAVFYQNNVARTRVGFGVAIGNRNSLGFTNADHVGSGVSVDTALFRDAAGTLAQRNGINAQTFRLYNTYTDDTTFERLNITWDTNVLKIGTDKGSVGGSGRAIQMESYGGITMRNLTGSSSNLILETKDTGSNSLVIKDYLGAIRTYFSIQGNMVTNSPVSINNGATLIINEGGTNFVPLQVRTNWAYIDTAYFKRIASQTSDLTCWLDEAGTKQIVINSNFRLGIGTSTPTEKLDVVGNVKVSGHFSAATKSFLIDHPTKEGKKLQYGVVESNQHSVLVRGKTAENIIELPEEWAGLVHEDSVTVQLTPIGSYQQLFVISQDNQRVVVGGSTGQYNYTIYGERKDVDKLITEI